MSKPFDVRKAVAALALTGALSGLGGCASWTIPEQEFRDGKSPVRTAKNDERPTAQFGSSSKARSIESNVGIH